MKFFELHSLVLFTVYYFNSIIMCMEVGTSLKKSTALLKPQDDTYSSNSSEYTFNSDAKLTTSKLIEKYGYNVEEHTVVTKDSYILTLFRIPSKQNSDDNITRINHGKVVLLVHGFFGSSTDWASNSNENALVYRLAEEGFDVWLANLRGNVYSRKHVYLNPDGIDYWNFSFHEMGKYDIPATVDYILNTTNQAKLNYVSHSLGANVLLVASSINPKIGDKIRILFALAPSVFIDNMSSPLRYLAPLAYSEQVAVVAFGRTELVAASVTNIIKAFGPSSACNLGKVSQDLCLSALHLIANVNNAQVNSTWLPVILSNYPNRVSSKTLIHLLQVYNSRLFQEYDYGYLENLSRYGQSHPPEYTLSRFKAPVALFSAMDDILVSLHDVARLRNRLPNVISDTLVPSRDFGHFGFLFSNKAAKLVYNDIVRMIKVIS